MVEHPAVNRRVVGSTPTGETRVMDYKSFLIDHHFCVFRGIFAHFVQFHSKSIDRVTENPLPGLFLCPKKRDFTLEVSRTISTAWQALNIKTELKKLIYSIYDLNKANTAYNKKAD